MATRAKSTAAKQAKQRKAYQRRRGSPRSGPGRPSARRSRPPASEGLPVTQSHAAGIDIGSRSHWVCVGCSQ